MTTALAVLLIFCLQLNFVILRVNRLFFKSSLLHVYAFVFAIIHIRLIASI